MPLLSLDSLFHMLSMSAIKCPECGRDTHQNYCRQCDEFYRIGHARDCTQYGEHNGHRIYPTPPVMPFEAQWTVYLDVTREKHVWIEHTAIEAMFGEGFGSHAYRQTFMEMGDRALAWADGRTFQDGRVYVMHFDGSTLDLRIGVVGG